MTIIADRSRVMDYQACPRKRYWGYEYKGRGIQDVRVKIPLLVGGAVHVGVEHLLGGATLETSLLKAKQYFVEELGTGELAQTRPADQEFARAENLRIVEAMIRVYHLVQLPRLLAEYEIVGIEREYEELLDPIGPLWMARTDADLKSRETGKLTVYSLKTASSIGPWTDDQARLDMQGKSESWAVAQARGEKPEAVKMDFLVKGKYEFSSSFLEGKIYNNPILHPWKKGEGLEAEYSPTYQRARGWRRITIGSPGEINMAEWFERLASYQYFEASPDFAPTVNPLLESMIHTPIPYCRTDEEIESWRRQMRSQEEEVAARAEAVNGIGDLPRELHNPVLDEYFGQSTARCHDYNDPCPFYKICWEGVSPDDTTFYKIRRANHERERREHETKA